jgi:hypothetical protein
MRSKTRAITQKLLSSYPWLPEFFWERVTKNKNGCWVWIGSLANGKYGRIHFPHGVELLAHRVAYVLQKKEDLPAGEGTLVRHSCDNPLCVRASHLRKGTHVQNMKDMVTRGRVAVGSRQGSSKLSESDVLTIRRLWAKDPKRYTQTRLSERFSVTQTAIWQVVHRKKWTHI